MKNKNTFGDSGWIFSPVRGRHYLLSRGSTTYREIFYSDTDPAPRFPFQVLVPYFQNVYKFRFEWKTLMPETEAIKKGLRPLLTFEKNIKSANEGPDAAVVQKMSLVFRVKEDQHYLLDREVHPFEVRVVSSDGVAIDFIFKFIIKIDDMLILLAKFSGGNFLTYIENQITSKLGTRLRQQEFTALHGISVDGIQDDCDKVRDEVNAKIQNLNYGFEILDVMHEATIIPPESTERIKAEQSIKIAEFTKKAAITTGEGRAAVIKLEGNAETEVQTKRTKNVGAEEVTVLENTLKAQKNQGVNLTAVAIAKELSNLKGTLVFGPNANLVDSMTANKIQTNDEKGGGNE